jgi:hypothetical protein
LLQSPNPFEQSTDLSQLTHPLLFTPIKNLPNI